MINLDISELDRYLSRHGQFVLLDWLIEQNIIRYSDYEAWRYGSNPHLVEDKSELYDDLNLLTQTATRHCSALKLDCERVDYLRWDGNSSEPLQVVANQGIHKALTQRWISAKSKPQMDLFMDNSAAIAENNVIEALTDRQFNAAEGLLEKLTELNPSLAKLGHYLDLINYGLHTQSMDAVDDVDVEAELHGLEQEVVPLATELLGAQKRDYLAFAWRRIAKALEQRSYDDEQPKLHKSYALAQIPDWRSVRLSLEAESQLAQFPRLSARLAEAYLQERHLGLCDWVWGLSFDRFGDQMEVFVGASKHPELIKIWDDFLSFDDEIPENAFLGYLLIRQPGLVHLAEDIFKRTGMTIVQEYNRAVLDLLSTRLADGSEKTHRAHLQSVCPALLKYYLNKRDWYASLKKGR